MYFRLELKTLGATQSLDKIVIYNLTFIIIQQIVTMPIYGKEALNICHPT